MTTPARPVTVEGMCARQMSHRLDRIIEQVGGLVRDLRLIQTRIDAGEVGTGDYASLAAQAQKAIIGMMFNACAHSLTDDAAHADRARTAGIVAETIALDIEATVGAYPDVPRPKAERGLHLNDPEWAARVARQYAAREA